jgi:hypothetical protein
MRFFLFPFSIKMIFFLTRPEFTLCSCCTLYTPQLHTIAIANEYITYYDYPYLFRRKLISANWYHLLVESHINSFRPNLILQWSFKKNIFLCISALALMLFENISSLKLMTENIKLKKNIYNINVIFKSLYSCIISSNFNVWQPLRCYEIN